MTKTKVAAGTHTGLVRKKNEDRYGATGLVTSLVDGEITYAEHPALPFLAVIADGLGGHPCGEVASTLAVEHLLAARPPAADALVASVHGANRAIVDAMNPLDGSVGMGTTIAAVLVHAAGLAVVNVGDSVVLELVDGRLVQLSTDDVPRGWNLPGIPSTVVTQTLGGARGLVKIEPHVVEGALAPPRRLLLSTDGLTNFVPRADIIAALGEHHVRAAGERLLELALFAGGADNVTCVLVEVY